MQLYDPTSSGAERNLSRAAALASLEGKTIGILENGKLNAVEMLHEVADLFVQAERLCHSCGVFEIERQRAGAVRDLGPGSGGGGFPHHRPG